MPVEASYWSRSLESDATVRADYALTANKNTAKQTNRVSATFDINNTTFSKATIVLNFESLLISPDPTYLVDCLTDYSRTGIAV